MQANYGDLLEEVRRFWIPLPDKPEETPERVLHALWRTASGAPVSAECAARDGLPALDGAALDRLRGLLERRRAGVPLAHLTGRQSFLGLELLAGAGALIPRKETEILGRAALAKLHALAECRGVLRVIDLCTGSGNLAVAYAFYERRARVFASDLEAPALDLARANAGRAGVPLELRQGDLFEPFESPEFVGACDFVSCNPPYISSARVRGMHPEIAGFEPQAAFDGGAFGVSILMKLIRNAPRFLKARSWLGFEVGAGQGAGIVRQLRRNPAFAAVEPFSDAGGEIRAVLARSH